MSNNNRDMMDYDDAKELRRNLITFVLLLGAFLVIVFWIVRQNDINNVKQDIEDKKAEKVKIEQYNKKVDEQSLEQSEKIGLADITKDMKKFNDLFYNWDSWKAYTDNMKELRSLYPRIDEGKVVNISGRDVGTGKSPKSSHTSDFYTTTNPNEIAVTVEQKKDGISDKSSAFWYIVGEKQNGETLDIKHMKRYRDISQ